MNLIRQFIRSILYENMWNGKAGTFFFESHDEDTEEDLLLEPDIVEEPYKDKQEASVVANIAGVSTPLGTGPTYPNKPRRKRKSRDKIGAKSFGGAKFKK